MPGALCQMGFVDQPLSRVVGGRHSRPAPRSMCDRSSSDEETAPSRGPQDARSPAVSHNRFTPLDDGQEADVVDHRSQSDTESVVGLSSVGPDLVEAIEEEQFAEFRVSQALRDALVSLDDVNVEIEFRRRANLMRSARSVRVSSAICNGRSSRVDAPTTRFGRLFFKIPRVKLRERFAQFAQGRHGPKFGFRVEDRDDGSSSRRLDHTFRLRVDRTRVAGAH